ncbi:MAG: sugar ABC transporter ATP-binding protein [Campylobacteraceae bacterium]|nr:sugar ABC transporter ATP-binding protein [Campylobacteraceae bacterium]
MALDKVIEIKNAFKSFGKTEVLKGVDFTLFKGETLVLLGDNGAGKSTLIKCICGFDEFDKFDEFKLNQNSLSKKDISFKKMRNLGIEVVFQENAVCKNQELYRNIFATRHITKFGLIDKKKEIEITNEILKTHLKFSGAGLNAKSNALNLSGGERQGLAIARAIYFKSNILIMDEPTTALGVTQQNELSSYLKSLENVSVILITHNLNKAYELGKRFMLLKDGAIQKSALKSELPNLESLYRFSS